MGELTGDLKALVDEKSAIVSGWIDRGKLAPVDPQHLIFMIWATTQHYADFATRGGGHRRHAAGCGLF